MLYEEIVLLCEKVVEFGRPLILTKYPIDSCIVSARIVQETLDYFGINAIPLPVSVLVQNPRMVQHWADGAEDSDVQRAYDEGAWAVGLACSPFPPPLGMCSCHLVNYIATEQILIDMTLDQAAKPEKGINLTPIVVPSVRAFPFWIERNGCLLIYEQKEIDNGWRNSPYWGCRDRRPIVGALIRRLKECGFSCSGFVKGIVA